MRILLIALVLLSTPACAVDLAQIRLPEGFAISHFARDVPNARQMAWGDDGTLFVGSRGAGNVYALRDEDGDGSAERRWLIAEGLNLPSGIAFRDGSLYVAAVDRVLRYDDIERRLDAPPQPVLLSDQLPGDRHHGWKYLGFGPDGMLYVPVGGPCNVCLRSDPRYAGILRMHPDSGEVEVFASGVRNSVGFDWHPQTGVLWFSDNGRDWLGDELPPEEINRAPRAGLHFGFPFVYGDGQPDPEFGQRAGDQSFTAPALQLPAHNAPLGIVFYRGEQFPDSYRNALFIAEHGSWNRSEKRGYQLSVAFVEDGRASGYRPFASGWLAGGSVRGRPADVINAADGSLLVSDDAAGAIYRISYQR